MAVLTSAVEVEGLGGVKRKVCQHRSHANLSAELKKGGEEQVSRAAGVGDG